MGLLSFSKLVLEPMELGYSPCRSSNNQTNSFATDDNIIGFTLSRCHEAKEGLCIRL